MWAEVSGLTIKRLDDKYMVHIRVRWASRSHASYRDYLAKGVTDPIFNKGRKVVHAFRPDQGGSIHLDSDVKWVKGPNVRTGINSLYIYLFIF